MHQSCGPRVHSRQWCFVYTKGRGTACAGSEEVSTACLSPHSVYVGWNPGEETIIREYRPPPPPPDALLSNATRGGVASARRRRALMRTLIAHETMEKNRTARRSGGKRLHNINSKPGERTGGEECEVCRVCRIPNAPSFFAADAHSPLGIASDKT